MEIMEADAQNDMMLSIIQKYNLAVDTLTETQFADAIRQAIPDFTRHIYANKQSVVYIPGQEANRWRERFRELEAINDVMIQGMENIRKQIRNTPRHDATIEKISIIAETCLDMSKKENN